VVAVTSTVILQSTRQEGKITSIEPHLAHVALLLPDVHADPVELVSASPHTLPCDLGIQRMLTVGSQEQQESSPCPLGNNNQNKNSDPHRSLTHNHQINEQFIIAVEQHRNDSTSS
jgi:hypothetical protein